MLGDDAVNKSVSLENVKQSQAREDSLFNKTSDPVDAADSQSCCRVSRLGNVLRKTVTASDVCHPEHEAAVQGL